jgi:SAM-dependent methyltransferase
LENRQVHGLLAAMKIFDYLLEQPFLFNLSQLPFTRQKFARILSHNDITRVRRILDVGCGPGTNTKHFRNAQYLGIDINAKYIELARQRYNRDFLVADVTKYEVASKDTFDFVLINSFLHHIDTGEVDKILSQITQLLAPEGHVHSIEVVLPDRKGLSYLLARWDRGNFPRPIHEWRSLFTKYFATVVFEPFSVVQMGQELMQMVYFKGRNR